LVRKNSDATGRTRIASCQSCKSSASTSSNEARVKYDVAFLVNNPLPATV